jgi:excisionase family DNA binding protein
MTNDWTLTLTDVADVLACTREDVLAAIDEGHLRVMPGRKVRVAHRDLLEFVAATQRAALSLGSMPLFEPNLIASRPVESLDVNRVNRS